MKLPFRQSWQLRGIERRVRRSEPHMAAMLAIFTRLNAGEAITSREQVQRTGNWLRPFLAVLAAAIAGLAAAARRVCDRTARLCAAACRRLGRAARVPSSTSPGRTAPQARGAG